MNNLLRWACAVACVLLPSLASAQVPTGIRAAAPAGFLPGGAQYCSSDSGVTWVPCMTVRPYQAVTPMTVDVTAAAGRGWKAACTVAGNVAIVLADGSTDTVPLNAGLSILPYSVTRVVAAGTTATCTYANLN